MTDHQDLLLEDLFWGLHNDIRDTVAGMWLLALVGSAELTSDANGTISLTLNALGEQHTEKVVVDGVLILPEKSDGADDDDQGIALAGRADAEDVEAANGDVVQAIASNHLPLLDMLEAFVAAGLKTSWSIDPDTGATRVVARREGMEWAHAFWHNDPAEGWVFDDCSTWVEEDGVRRHVSADELMMEGFAWAPDWALTTEFPDAAHGVAPSLPLRSRPSTVPPTPSEIETRKLALAQWASVNGFKLRVDAPTPMKIAAKLGRSRAGIYLIEFADGACYVGKAIDIANRFRAHARKYGDIVTIRLRPEPEAITKPNPDRYLLGVERPLIDSAQIDGLTARNKDGMSVILASDQPFDELISSRDQEAWRADRLSHNRVDFARDRTAGVEALRAGAAHNFKQFSTSLSTHDQQLVMDIVAAFLARCVPLPLLTEVRHWTLSCMPSTIRGGATERFQTIACLSVGATEALTIVQSKTSGRLSGFVHIYEPELTDGSEYEWMALTRRNRGARLRYAGYKDAGPESALYEADDLAVLQRLVNDVAVTRAAAALCLNLMRARASAATRRQSHNPEFAGECLSRATQFCM